VQIALSIRNLSKEYTNFGGSHRVVSNLTLSVPRGEVFGFLGPNGAGKTTTIKMIVGLAFPTRGTIEIFGEPSNTRTVRARVGFMSENPYFYSYLTAQEFMLFSASLLNLSSIIAHERTASLLNMVGLSGAADQQIRTFSKGMNQRLGFAQALLGDPEIVFLDEPLDGLDPLGRVDFKRMIQALKKEGKTIFFNSHILSDVQELCDSIGIIHKGKLVESGPLTRILKGRESLEEHFIRVVGAKK
jgi:ABC-2 type transport system ATP-binding protein